MRMREKVGKRTKGEKEERGEREEGVRFQTRRRRRCEAGFVLTILHLWNSPATSFNASMTMRAAMTALVVAMAGMMLPAMAGGGRRREGRGETDQQWRRVRRYLTFHVKSTLQSDVIVEGPQI